jgi:hypothetical protein
MSSCHWRYLRLGNAKCWRLTRCASYPIKLIRVPPSVITSGSELSGYYPNSTYRKIATGKCTVIMRVVSLRLSLLSVYSLLFGYTTIFNKWTSMVSRASERFEICITVGAYDQGVICCLLHTYISAGICSPDCPSIVVIWTLPDGAIQTGYGCCYR